jgi:hypothetical protein
MEKEITMGLRQDIERFSQAAEDLAKAMDASGIGQHATQGHAAVLRRMASSMRADAAQGKTPFAFTDNSVYAAATASQLPAQIVHTMRASGLEMGPNDTIALDDLNETFSRAGTDPGDRIAIKSALAAAGRLTAS